jgi:DNA polymerase (family 10)
VTELDNAAVAERLEAFAGLLDLAGASGYSARAYLRAAETIRATDAQILELARQGRAQELRGIGPGIAARLCELAETGTIAELDELRREVRPELVGLGRMVGLSPTRTVEIATALGVETPDDFRQAALEGRLREAPGVGPATEAKILERLRRGTERPRRGLTINRARPLVGEIANALGGELSGDPRRWADLSFDLAVVVPTTDPSAVVDAFAVLPQIVTLVERDERRAVGVTVEGVPVVLHLPAPRTFGTELVRRTGAPAYVEALEPLPEGTDEEAVYASLGIPWCPPELREAPFRGEPPALVELEDVRGDLHSHTTWSDGRASVREMALAARGRGYEYLAICDHTVSVRVVPGLDADAVRRQSEEIAAANEELAPFRVLRGIEVDIRRDGSLDLPDDVLAELDWVQASVHAGQRQSADRLTKRTLAAVEHPAVRSISHPQGRILNHRPPNAVGLDAVYAACLETGTALETNGLPDRIDLSSTHVRDAIRGGVRVTCSTDAHSVRGLANMRLAVATARRGWATAADVLNTRPLEDVLSR